MQSIPAGIPAGIFYNENRKSPGGKMPVSLASGTHRLQALDRFT